MRRRAALVGSLLPVVAAFGACAAPQEVRGGWEAPTTAPSDPPVRTLTDGFVLDAGDEPVLCEDGVALSLPPKCSGKRVDGWDWSTVEHESASGVRWGDFDLELLDHGSRYELVTVEPAAGSR